MRRWLLASSLALASVMSASAQQAASPDRPILGAAAGPQAPILKGAGPSGPIAPATVETIAASALVYDMSSQTLLLAKDIDRPIPPASMGKMMTVYVAFELIAQGKMRLDQKIAVSPETWRAWNNQGSTMFLRPGEEVTVDELLHGIITLSGNDACVVLAEGVAGTEAAYVAIMNATAKRIGMKASSFANTTGWPDPNEFVTARDLALLAERTIRDYPDLYKRYYPVASFKRVLKGETAGGADKVIEQPNRNPLLGRVAGADGLKTGHTQEAGYGFVGSAERNGQRLITVVSGLPSMAARGAESVKLMEWGFRAFEHVTLYSALASVEKMPVWMGQAQSVDMVSPTPIALTLPRGAASSVQVRLRYSGPVEAPVKKGQRLGELIISAPGKPARSVPLVAANAVERVSGFAKLAANLRALFGGGPRLPEAAK
jgi:serine-type D-Ala-D-Ala carboxypeptidase (penicillin-binding protein 5/6)